MNPLIFDFPTGNSERPRLQTSLPAESSRKHGSYLSQLPVLVRTIIDTTLDTHSISRTVHRRHLLVVREESVGRSYHQPTSTIQLLKKIESRWFLVDSTQHSPSLDVRLVSKAFDKEGYDVDGHAVARGFRDALSVDSLAQRGFAAIHTIFRPRPFEPDKRHLDIRAHCR